MGGSTRRRWRLRPFRPQFLPEIPRPGGDAPIAGAAEDAIAHLLGHSEGDGRAVHGVGDAL